MTKLTRGDELTVRWRQGEVAAAAAPVFAASEALPLKTLLLRLSCLCRIPCLNTSWLGPKKTAMGVVMEWVSSEEI